MMLTEQEETEIRMQAPVQVVSLTPRPCWIVRPGRGHGEPQMIGPCEAIALAASAAAVKHVQDLDCMVPTAYLVTDSEYGDVGSCWFRHDEVFFYEAKAKQILAEAVELYQRYNK